MQVVTALISVGGGVGGSAHFLLYVASFLFSKKGSYKTQLIGGNLLYYNACIR